MKSKKSGVSKKKIVKHLKGDIATFKKEAAEDKELIAAMKAKKKKKPKEDKRPHKKQEEKKEAPGKKKFEKVMREFGEGKLHSGSKKGPKVTKLSQARAIAFSEDRRANKKRK